MGADHPESPLRQHAIEDALIAGGVMDFLQYREAPAAALRQIKRVHDGAYTERILSFKHKPGRTFLDPDTLIMEHTPEAALRAAGAVILASDMVMEGKVRNAFCNIRPPGHHATRDETMGFCFFNNVAVGVAHVLHRFKKIGKVAICDFDVHHGNGTEAIFTEDPRIMLCSTFQHPFFPYTAFAETHDRMINVPLPAGTRSEDFRTAVTQKWLPALKRFQPQLIFISAGFDAHREDDMSHFLLTDADFDWITREIMQIAKIFAEERVVSVLEGGYHLPALARCTVQHIKILMGMAW
jgi:acetoin utilization deacetylase AcuC-like enzyme